MEFFGLQVIGVVRVFEYKVLLLELFDFLEDFDKLQERCVDVFDFLQYIFGFQVCGLGY